MVLALLLLQACGSSDDGAGLAVHTIGFGGDITLGRALNEALYEPARRARVFAGMQPDLSEVDIALFNAEGVISGGGRFFDKGESRPHSYRAAPEAMDMLRDAGVDVLTMGNNHSVDYGPAALVESLDRAHAAGIATTGAGEDEAHARAPAYRTVGDVTVAFVGGDLTYTEPFAARPDRAGILWLPGMEGKRLDDVVGPLLEIAIEARKHADLVILTPHWGDNFVTEPSRLTRKLARRLISGGYDAILGHSAHMLQGVELIGGKPVVYDAGNAHNDYPARPNEAAGTWYRVHFDRRGVRDLEVRPLELGENETSFATGDRAAAILADWRARTEALGTDVRVDGEIGHVVCDPGAAEKPPASPPPPLPTVSDVRLAPADLILDAVPDIATRADVRWEGGLSMAGFHVLTTALRAPKAGQIITLYLSSDAPVPDDLVVMLRAQKPGKKGQGELGSHLPGDWLLPGSRWPVGKIVRDQSLFRLMTKAEGSVRFDMALARGRDLLVPTQSDRPVHDASYVELVTGTYDRKNPGIFEIFPASAPP